MDFVKIVSAYGLVKDLRLSDEDSKLSTVLELAGFGEDESNMLLGAARAVAPSQDVLVMDFIQAKGFGSAMNLLLKQSESEDVRKLGDYMTLADLNISADDKEYASALAPIGVDAETAGRVRQLIQKNASPGQSLAAFLKSPEFPKMLYAINNGQEYLPSSAGVIACPHCDGLIKP